MDNFDRKDAILQHFDIVGIVRSAMRCVKPPDGFSPSLNREMSLVAVEEVIGFIENFYYERLDSEAITDEELETIAKRAIISFIKRTNELEKKIDDILSL